MGKKIERKKMFYSVRDVAKMAGRTRQEIIRRIWLGQIKAVKISKVYLIHYTQLKNVKELKILILALVLATLTIPVPAQEINMPAIARIESSGHPLAYNKATGARGKYQITSVCLADYNQYHKDKYTLKELFNPAINEKIASWYFNKRIPQLLKYYHKKLTIENILTAYNAGIKKVGNPPKETKEYIKKYKRLVRDERKGF